MVLIYRKSYTDLLSYKPAALDLKGNISSGTFFAIRPNTTATFAGGKSPVFPKQIPLDVYTTLFSVFMPKGIYSQL